MAEPTTAMAESQPAPRLDSIPTELQLMICALLDTTSLKNLRWASRGITGAAAAKLFETVFFSLLPTYVESLSEISKHPTFSQHVRKLVYHTDVLEEQLYHTRQLSLIGPIQPPGSTGIAAPFAAARQLQESVQRRQRIERLAQYHATTMEDGKDWRFLESVMQHLPNLRVVQAMDGTDLQREYGSIIKNAMTVKHDCYVYRLPCPSCQGRCGCSRWPDETPLISSLPLRTTKVKSLWLSKTLFEAANDNDTSPWSLCRTGTPPPSLVSALSELEDLTFSFRTPYYIKPPAQQRVKQRFGELLQSCPKLLSLTIHGRESALDFIKGGRDLSNEVDDLPQMCQLKRLSLTRCEISPASFKSLVRRLPNLRSLCLERVGFKISGGPLDPNTHFMQMWIDSVGGHPHTSRLKLAIERAFYRRDVWVDIAKSFPRIPKLEQVELSGLVGESTSDVLEACNKMGISVWQDRSELEAPWNQWQKSLESYILEKAQGKDCGPPPAGPDRADLREIWKAHDAQQWDAWWLDSLPNLSLNFKTPSWL